MTKIQEVYPNLVIVVRQTIEDLERSIRLRQTEIETMQRAVAALKLVATEAADPIGDAASVAIAGELAIPRRSPLANFRSLARSNGDDEVVKGGSNDAN
jgi:hypothetical protein